MVIKFIIMEEDLIAKDFLKADKECMKYLDELIRGNIPYTPNADIPETEYII